MAILMVTGTNTDVGKTVATAVLARGYLEAGYDVIAIKPVQTGEPEGHGDAVTVRALSGIETYEFIRYPEPLAPNLAAQRAGMPTLDLADTAARIRGLDRPGRVVLVEGAGGLLVRMAKDWNIADLAAQLAAPMVVVTSTELGSLNLAELTVEAAQRRGVEVVGLIGGRLKRDNDLATELNLAEFSVVTGVPYLGSIREGALDDLDRVEVLLPAVVEKAP
ncbi:dethiobiotin synthase [Corynebacterium epidermidicanis]|uniref:ATP-dependent dethiobiotin synthetase BioD n=1 Tax=Corynebacterium epidermidicanis TaxID=1050174 RepID=A0A0G3GW12_9CORY|nr:dethiobiotin synthase [Corynebacterium epidermidicanis]AKK03062.1 dethiobiotin synthase [Corynebacterium epidermidicanis]